MNNSRAEIMASLQKASSLTEQMALVSELEAFDARQASNVAQSRSLDLAGAIVEQTLSPVRTHEFHTASTDWLSLDSDNNDAGYHQAVMAKAALWFGKVSPEVKADRAEFVEQAQGIARRTASAYGVYAPAAQEAFLSYVAFLNREAASGLDQVDQTTAPDGVTYKPTEYPAATFPTFEDAVHPINEQAVAQEGTYNNPLLSEIDQLGQGQGQAEWPPVPGGGAAGVTSVAISHAYNLDEFKQREAASTLDQITQTTAPDGVTYAPTPLPGEVAYPWILGGPVVDPEADDQDFTQAAPAAIDKAVAARRTAGDNDMTFNYSYGRHLDENGGAHNDGKCTPPCQHYGYHRITAHHGKDPLPVGEIHWAEESSDWASPGEVENIRVNRDLHNSGLANRLFNAATAAWRDGRAEHRPYLPSSTFNPSLFEEEGLEPKHFPKANELEQVFGEDSSNEGFPEFHQRRGTTASRKTADMFGNSDMPHAVPQPGVANSPATTPQPQQGGSYMAGFAAGMADGVSGDAATYADNSAGLPFGQGYVEGYTKGFAQLKQTRNPKDVPRSAGGDSGQEFLSGTAARKTSSLFTPEDASKNNEFRKAYKFASKWDANKPLVRTGSAEFEAGLYAGISDNIGSQDAWVAKHGKQATKYPEFSKRIALHKDFSLKVIADQGGIMKGAYLRVESATSTDLDTLAPGSSPSEAGETPINGPGRPGPLAGGMDPAAPAGAAPYNGAEPFGQGVVPGGISTATPATNQLSDPRRLAAFRQRVQSSLKNL